MSLLALLALMVPPPAAAQPACGSSTLDAAEDTFGLGRFERTYDLLLPCLPDGFSARNQRVGAYRLLALSSIARDSVDHAREYVRLLLREDSRFRPDPQADPRLFNDLVHDLKPKWYSWLWRGNEWYKWAGRSALVGGAVAVPLLLRGSTEPDLPGLPNGGLPPAQ